jgi:hypothetical protein
MKENRQLTNALTQFSENSKHEDENNFKSTVNDNWNEAVTPWKAIVSHPSYYPHHVYPNVEKYSIGIINIRKARGIFRLQISDFTLRSSDF